MAELRPFPPSPRRRALARQAGLHAASPILVGGVACASALVAIAMLGAAAAARIGAWIASAVRLESALAPRDVMRSVLELAAPIVVVIALVAVIAHFAQTRSPWMPRRAIAGAPSIAPARTRRAGFDLAAAAIIGVVAFAWLWLVAPRIAALPSAPLAGGLMIASAAATLAIAWVTIGVFDALVRYRELSHALYMTPREKREDERLGGIDPRWRRPREEPSSVAGATLLVLGDDIAIAVAWDPIHRPIPTRTATGRGAKATQLLALARRHAVPVHRDALLARRLLDTGPVPEVHWPRLAEIIAAVRR
ncbi:MAG: EscU/YscU/HrcU family type III secretion system export apparatus switch protein [Myxococcota bacterium]|nr:EscU/YscU/HrcU family type III secretion system export apparatus switch protein [Myxococcota bacterium]